MYENSVFYNKFPTTFLDICIPQIFVTYDF
jgi:hypothetical protein